MRYTRDHELIQQWAVKHGAIPAEIKPLKFDGKPSVLYFLFEKTSSQLREIRPITWDDFFARFDVLDLCLKFDECSADFELCTIKQKAPQSLD